MELSKFHQKRFLRKQYGEDVQILSNKVMRVFKASIRINLILLAGILQESIV